MADRLVWAEIDSQAFADNLTLFRRHIAPAVKLMAVVKGNAYGHGIVPLATQAVSQGVDYLGVACLYEAKRLRDAGLTCPILLLGYTDAGSVEQAVKLHISLTVMDTDVVQAVTAAAEKYGKIAHVHVKLDTGMHRLGVSPDNALSFISSLVQEKHIFLEGIFTHFATADEEDLSFTRKQLAIFRKVIEALSARGINPPLIHAANSAATLRLPEAHFSMVRIGKGLYGPLPIADKFLPWQPKPVLSLKTIIAQVRMIPKGDAVGYGRTFIAPQDMAIATIPVGYADGFRRSPKNWGKVLVHGKKVPLVGLVSMDQAMIDISGVSCNVGDEVVLLGEQRGERITTEAVAQALSTTNYEVIASLAERVGRVYR